MSRPADALPCLRPSFGQQNWCVLPHAVEPGMSCSILSCSIWSSIIFPAACEAEDPSSALALSSASESQTRSGLTTTLSAQGLTSAQAGGHEEGHFQGLLRIEPRVAVRVVAVAKVDACSMHSFVRLRALHGRPTLQHDEVLPHLSLVLACRREGNACRDNQAAWPTCHARATADAFGHIVTSHLQVQTTRHRAHLFVHIKECLDLQQSRLQH